MFTYTHHILIIISLVTLINTSSAFAEKFEEYKVRTAFLYNLARMVEWPSDKLANANTPFIFCLFGEDFFGDMLDSLKNKTVKNRSLFLKRNVSLKELGQCQLLFISRSESERLSNILPYVENLPVLTVSDVSGFVEQGGIVNLPTQGTRIQIEVNLQAAKKAGLIISSRLLSVARIVEKTR